MSAPSLHRGMGSVPYPGGVAFRVWAPGVEDVRVILFDAAGRNPCAYPMAAEGEGVWSADVFGAQVGRQYLFRIAGESDRNDPRARWVSRAAGRSLVASRTYPWTATSYRPPARSDLVIYQMHLPSFPDNATSGAGMLEAVGEELWYLRALGVSAIELLPSQGDAPGFDAANLFAIDDSFGGPPAMKRLVDRAHALGLAVLVGVDYSRVETAAISAVAGVRTDYSHPQVRQILRDNAIAWLDEYQADGLCFGGTAFMRGDGVASGESSEGWRLMQWINDEIQEHLPGRIILATDLQHDELIVGRTGDGGAGFAAQGDAFAAALRDALVPADDSARSMASVQCAIERRYAGDAFARLLSTDGPVTDAADGACESLKRSHLAAAMMLTSPGMPRIAQGQELLERPPESPWPRRVDWTRYCRKAADCADCDCHKHNRCRPDGAYARVFRLYRDLIRLRRNAGRNTAGLQGQHVNVFHVNERDKVIAFHRWDRGGEGDDVVVVANFGGRRFESYTIGLPRGGAWRLRFNSDWRGYDDRFTSTGYDTTAASPGHDGLPCQGNVGLGAYSVIVLS